MQNKDKQIKEMEEIGSKHPCDRENCSKCLAMNRRCNDFLFAEHLYNAGYRKSTVLAEEIFAEIEAVLNKMFEEYAVLGQADCCMITEIIWRKLSAKLKKKYIGKDTNVTTKETEDN